METPYESRRTIEKEIESTDDYKALQAMEAMEI